MHVERERRHGRPRRQKRDVSNFCFSFHQSCRRTAERKKLCNKLTKAIIDRPNDECVSYTWHTAHKAHTTYGRLQCATATKWANGTVVHWYTHIYRQRPILMRWRWRCGAPWITVFCSKTETAMAKKKKKKSVVIYFFFCCCRFRYHYSNVVQWCTGRASKREQNRVSETRYGDRQNVYQLQRSWQIIISCSVCR